MEQQKLNPTIVYVLSIIGLLCCCIAGSGVLLAGPAFFIAQSGLKKAIADPDNYDQASVKAMKTAKIIALVVLIINAIYLIVTIYRIYTVGWDEMMRQSQEMMDQWQQNQ